MESQTIHFFAIEQEFIIAIVTSKDLPRDKIESLATQLVTTMHRYSEEEIGENSHFLQEITTQINDIQSSFIRERHLLKIILVGDGAVGKTSIRRQYLGEGFKNDYQMTIGADLATKESPVVYSGGRQVKYLIWDLAGQPRFENVREGFYRGTKGALLVFDLTRKDTYENIPKWIIELLKNNSMKKVPMILIGNKSDLRGSLYKTIPSEYGENYAKELSLWSGFDVPYIETSAKFNDNVEQPFETLIKQIIKASQMETIASYLQGEL
ncbi:MAG: GTP-binding protein [Candidatus Heimdallarchaeota archaeon]|nr:GTP-binding protein [Candidatus Heimdallarchaeota archaeon]